MPPKKDPKESNELIQDWCLIAAAAAKLPQSCDYLIVNSMDREAWRATSPWDCRVGHDWATEDTHTTYLSDKMSNDLIQRSWYNYLPKCAPVN